VKALSSRQQHIIDFISRFWREKNYPPTVRDIVNGCGISSTSVADYNLSILERNGYINRQPGISRSIKLADQSSIHGQNIRVPVIGLIAAGEPIPVPTADVWNDAASSETLEVTEDLTLGRQDIYALKVKGNSMIDALINDGDVVLMQSVGTVENGETAAVWLKAEKEVTLKKVYHDRDKIRLQPANDQMDPIYTAPENVEIQGRVIGVIRQLD
jgi:repressor LexA